MPTTERRTVGGVCTLVEGAEARAGRSLRTYANSVKTKSVDFYEIVVNNLGDSCTAR